MNPITDVIKNLASGAGKGILDGAKGIISQFVADPTAKLQAEDKLKELELAHEEKMTELNNQLDITAQQNLTDRDVTDMKSDSWLSKNIRPLMLIYLAVSTTIICVLDSCKVLTVSAAWITLLTSAFLSALGYYYVGRSIEKGISIKNS